MKTNNTLPDPTGTGYLFAVTDDSDYYMPNVLHVQRDDSMNIFPSDEAAARVAESNGIALIYGMPDVPDGVYIDTLENRAAISDYFKWEQSVFTAGETLMKAIHERLDANFAEYKSEVLRYSGSEIWNEAAEIAAVCQSYDYFRNEHSFKIGEAEFLLKFENPLEFLSDRWGAAPVAHARTIEGIFANQERTLQKGGYKLMPDDPDAPLAVPEPPPRNAPGADERPSVLARIRQHTAEQRERPADTKDAPGHKKSGPEL